MALRHIAIIASLTLAACEKAPPTALPVRESPPRQSPAKPQTPPPPETPPKHETSAPATASPAKEPPAAATQRFSEMTEPQKRAHMTDVVAPRLRELFATFDADRFSVFGCHTCHGYVVRGGGMPRPSGTLPRLRLSGDGLAQLQAKQPEMVAFMTDVVVPTMAKAMGEAPYDPATGKGFGCAGCHAVQ